PLRRATIASARLSCLPACRHIRPAPPAHLSFDHIAQGYAKLSCQGMAQVRSAEHDDVVE
ncbi:hypothetical protein, partial [Candidatus Binatus sp.]|uniref:hypothetical protein n=1 Tax=Candidatus Binatus sp. TaxID=2811406 RepID=UPI003BDBA7E7